MSQTSCVRTGLAWATAEAGPIPTTATPPVNSAPAMIRFRVLWVLMMRCPFVRRGLAGRLQRILRHAGVENMGHLPHLMPVPPGENQ